MGTWLLPWVALLLLALGPAGCDQTSSSSAIPILAPNFVVEDVKTDHGLFTAVWYITIRNNGGPGSMTVQKWVGSADDPASRSVIYSERLRLGALERTTLKVEWTHGAVGTLYKAMAYGAADGVDFLP